jgi:glycosyltransferase involved in cell wall biosynthesis
VIQSSEFALDVARANSISFTSKPLVTIAVPSFNQARFLDQALSSIFDQQIPVEVFVMDGGSSDESIEIIRKWDHHLSGWRSYSDKGQSSAVNEGISQGSAPFVCWLNSDDWLLPGSLLRLIEALHANPNVPVVYGRAWNFKDKTKKKSPVWIEPFSEKKLALRCIISQPATLIRRSAWEAVGGVDEKLHLAMDYDLWWRLYRRFGSFHFVDAFTAVNRDHKDTKTRTQRGRHYQEAIAVVKQHYGTVPLKWWFLQPYSVWYKSLIG